MSRTILPSKLATGHIAGMLAGLVAGGVWLSAAPAWAGSFTADGTFVFDPLAAAKFDFEEVPDADAGVDGGPMGPIPVEDEGALSGSHVLKLVSQQGVDVEVELPKEARSYRVSMWARGGEVVGDLEISYTEGRVSEVAALYPTGRVTSDGWYELANDHIRVDGARAKRVSVGGFSAYGAYMDAVEIIPDGGAADFPPVPNAHCNGVADVGACAADQVCVWSECRNVSGWVPPIPKDRDQVAAYMRARIQLLFGPYLERTIDMPESMKLLDAMSTAKDKWTYWNAFTHAVRRLHDGHTSTNGLADFVLRNPRPIAVCFIEGDADLTHGAAPKDPDYLDVLVSHVGNGNDLGLHAGDRLVSIDGEHPIAWARKLIGVNWGQPAISNHVTYAELASGLRGMIARYADTLQVIRCDASACGAVESIHVEDIPPSMGMGGGGVTCDNRPKRHLPSSPAGHNTGGSVYAGVVNESLPGEDIYGIEWESLYTTNGTDGVGADLNAAVSTWKASARGVIMDHRTGFGGTIAAPEILWRFAVPRRANDYYVDRTFGEEEQPDVTTAKALFDAAVANNYVQYAGTLTPVTDVPVALLVTEDVSASDWLPLGMKGAAPNIRIFGPFQTNGGFSTRYSFGYWLSMGYILAVGDDIQPDGTTHNGKGVEPDEVVLPKQSDLIAGKDSVYEAALAWVRANLKPAGGTP